MQIYANTLAELLEHHVAFEMAGTLIRRKADLAEEWSVIAELVNAEYDDELIAALWRRARALAIKESPQQDGPRNLARSLS